MLTDKHRTVGMLTDRHRTVSMLTDRHRAVGMLSRSHDSLNTPADLLTLRQVRASGRENCKLQLLVLITYLPKHTLLINPNYAWFETNCLYVIFKSNTYSSFLSLSFIPVYQHKAPITSVIFLDMHVHYKILHAHGNKSISDLISSLMKTGHCHVVSLVYIKAT